jgi:hypothetical protein
VNAPRALIIAGLSIALLAAATGSASAATISPTSADFGRLLIGKRSAPKTFTVTVSSGDRCRSPGPPGDCYPIQQDPTGGFATGLNTLGFLNNPSFGTCYQVSYLTATIPSCTIMVVFQPEEPGRLRGFVFPNYYEPLIANLTGIGLLSRKSIYCRPVRKGGIYKKNISRWCQRSKK